MKLRAPAAERNREPILAVLREELPPRGTVLEIASGSGTHAVHFARALTPLRWQPSDIAEEALDSIREHRAESGLLNLNPPVLLDVRHARWPVDHVEAVVCINMVHVAPWDAAEGLLRGSANVLPEGAPLCMYGPYRFNGEVTATSNLEFDQSLKARNPQWGVRDVTDLAAVGETVGLTLRRTVAMPANNHVLVFRREQ